MAKKMQERLRELEEQDVVDSWDEPDEAASSVAGLSATEAETSDMSRV